MLAQAKLCVGPSAFVQQPKPRKKHTVLGAGYVPTVCTRFCVISCPMTTAAARLPAAAPARDVVEDGDAVPVHRLDHRGGQLLRSDWSEEGGVRSEE